MGRHGPCLLDRNSLIDEILTYDRFLSQPEGVNVRIGAQLARLRGWGSRFAGCRQCGAESAVPRRQQDAAENRIHQLWYNGFHRQCWIGLDVPPGSRFSWSQPVRRGRKRRRRCAEVDGRGYAAESVSPPMAGSGREVSCVAWRAVRPSSRRTFLVTSSAASASSRSGWSRSN